MVVIIEGSINKGYTYKSVIGKVVTTTPKAAFGSCLGE